MAKLTAEELKKKVTERVMEEREMENQDQEQNFEEMLKKEKKARFKRKALLILKIGGIAALTIWIESLLIRNHHLASEVEDLKRILEDLNAVAVPAMAKAEEIEDILDAGKTVVETF